MTAGRLSRHTTLNNVLQLALRSAGIPSLLEPPGCSRNDGKRPDGMSYGPWSKGRQLIWDVTCVDTVSISNIVLSSSAGGTAAAEAEKRKVQKYGNLLDRFIFYPFGVETLGSWGPSAKKLVSEISHKIFVKSHEKRCFDFLKQRFSLAIQRGNAACILGTLPPQKALDEIFYVLCVR